MMLLCHQYYIATCSSTSKCQQLLIQRIALHNSSDFRSWPLVLRSCWTPFCRCMCADDASTASVWAAPRNKNQKREIKNLQIVRSDTLYIGGTISISAATMVVCNVAMLWNALLACVLVYVSASASIHPTIPTFSRFFLEILLNIFKSSNDW